MSPAKEGMIDQNRRTGADFYRLLYSYLTRFVSNCMMVVNSVSGETSSVFHYELLTEKKNRDEQATVI